MKRGTHQRNAIRKALLNAGRPLSVNEVFALAQNEVAGLGIATVYRNLKALQLEELIVQVDLPGQPPRWEKAPERHHHHFLCRTCDKLSEIQDCPEGLRHLLPEGYTLEEHDILLRGQCDTCTRVTNSYANRK
ncbi:MAG: transcriptional repressor [Chloroflexi bacterium]|nr:transcriptional repressor [Chloroflexota bacterium]